MLETRLFAALVVGVLFGWFSGPVVEQYVRYSGPYLQFIQIVVGLGAFAIVWYEAGAGLLDFSRNDDDIPEERTEPSCCGAEHTPAPVAQRPMLLPTRLTAEEVAPPAESIAPPSELPAERLRSLLLPEDARIEGDETGPSIIPVDLPRPRLELEESEVSKGGEFEVAVVAHHFNHDSFHRISRALQKVPGTRWSRATNENGRRRLQGIVPDKSLDAVRDIVYGDDK